MYDCPDLFTEGQHLLPSLFRRFVFGDQRKLEERERKKGKERKKCVNKFLLVSLGKQLCNFALKREEFGVKISSRVKDVIGAFFFSSLPPIRPS